MQVNTTIIIMLMTQSKSIVFADQSASAKYLEYTSPIVDAAISSGGAIVVNVIFSCCKLCRSIAVKRSEKKYVIMRGRPVHHAATKQQIEGTHQ